MTSCPAGGGERGTASRTAGACDVCPSHALPASFRPCPPEVASFDPAERRRMTPVRAGRGGVTPLRVPPVATVRWRNVFGGPTHAEAGRGRAMAEIPTDSIAGRMAERVAAVVHAAEQEAQTIVRDAERDVAARQAAARRTIEEQARALHDVTSSAIGAAATLYEQLQRLSALRDQMAEVLAEGQPGTGDGGGVAGGAAAGDAGADGRRAVTAGPAVGGVAPTASDPRAAAAPTGAGAAAGDAVVDRVAAGDPVDATSEVAMPLDPAAGDPAVDDPAVGGSAVGAPRPRVAVGPAVGGPAVGGPAADAPAVGGPAAGDPAVAASRPRVAVDPAVGGPAVADPAVADPAAGDPVAAGSTAGDPTGAVSEPTAAVGPAATDAAADSPAEPASDLTADAASVTANAAPEPVADAAASDLAPTSAPAPAPDPGVTADDDRADPAPAPPEDDPQLDAARLVALSMAASGRSAEAVATHLRDELGVADPSAIVDYVFGLSTPSTVVPGWPPRSGSRS
ncbi:hypothetical protein [Patulibacter defluvii]|uniref:hypothetical protein n=1 Tax=Patulibacter defluvii TaxID=3095358 RepID=UPI002A75143B|nr:hypothetical protein [Patulibacter sp. DM4]